MLGAGGAKWVRTQAQQPAPSEHPDPPHHWVSVMTGTPTYLSHLPDHKLLGGRDYVSALYLQHPAQRPPQGPGLPVPNSVALPSHVSSLSLNF